MDARYRVTKTGRTFGIVDELGLLVEGGFFERGAADAAAVEWNRQDVADHPEASESIRTSSYYSIED